MNKNLIRVLLVGGILLAVFNRAQAQDWLPTMTPATNWTGVASSADGSKLVAVTQPEMRMPGPVYLSTNSGASWTLATNAPATSWNCVASSADGNRLIASDFVGGHIYTSTNAGLNWISNNVPVASWLDVASSADGNILTAEVWDFYGEMFTNAPGGVYISMNAGADWNRTSAPTNDWRGLAMSADGAIQVAGSFEGQTIMTSTNYGQTWVSNNVPSQHWIGVTASVDGTHLAAVSSGYGAIYTSTNTGQTWVNANAPTNDYQNITSSADGSRLIAVDRLSLNICSSTNSGLTWMTNNAPRTQWDTACSSADGGKLAAVSIQGLPGALWPIYISQVVLPPQLNIQPRGTNLMLSWIIPSSNFVLQQSPDLVSWTDMTNVPVLNLTNLQDEVCLPPASASSFFRLR